MPDSLQEWAQKVFAGDRRAIARAISAVESGQPQGRSLLKLLFPRAGNAWVIGVTGSPGTGKSTLVEKLAAEYRRSGSRVGIVAVDPTSPFSGGAILGDRIRMQSLSSDHEVYIRSMATRGHLGGLATARRDVVAILDAAGCATVIVETVGVGQDEVEIARLADATLLLLVPGMGDDVQTFKAGLMEIADLFIINKADLPGANRVGQELAAMLSLRTRKDGWRPPIFETVATTGQGVGAVREALDHFHAYSEASALELHRRREKCRFWLLEMFRQALLERVLAEQLANGTLDHLVEQVLERRRDPYSVVEETLGGLSVESSKRKPNSGLG